MPSHKKHHQHHTSASSPAGAAVDNGHPEVGVHAQEDEVHSHTDLDPRNGTGNDDHFKEEKEAGPQHHHHHHRHLQHGDGQGEHPETEDGAGYNSLYHHHRFDDLSESDKIANLKELNETLVKQVCSSRTVVENLEGKVKALEEQLQQNAAKLTELSIDKNLIEEQKHNLELEIAASKDEAVILGADNANMVAEKKALFGEQNSLQSSLSETESKRKDVSQRLEETQRALSAAEQNAEVLNIEAVRFHKKEDELSSTIRALQASLEEAQIILNESQEKRASLEEKLNQFESSVASAEGRIEEANKVNESLQTELTARSKEREGFEMQLKEAWQQIAILEAQREHRLAWENSLQSQLKHLEDELAHVRMEHENASASVRQEREDKGLLKNELEVAFSKSRGLELGLESLKSSMSKLEDDSVKDQQLVCSLENELSILTEEKARIAEANSALEEEIRTLNTGSARASSEAKNEIEKLKCTVSALEKSLAEARRDAFMHHKNVTQLEVDLRELNFRVKQREKLTKMSLPVAIASSTSLLAIGLSALLKRARHH